MLPEVFRAPDQAPDAEQFEALLRRLYWASAVVHLETEVNGSHTFRWESERGFHTPQESDLQVRCAWEREGGRR